MAVNIDEAGRDSQTAGIDDMFRTELTLIQPAYFDDRVTLDCNVGRKPKFAGTIDDVTVADDEIKLRLWRLATGRQQSETDQSNNQMNPGHVENPHASLGKGESSGLVEDEFSGQQGQTIPHLLWSFGRRGRLNLELCDELLQPFE